VQRTGIKASVVGLPVRSFIVNIAKESGVIPVTPPFSVTCQNNGPKSGPTEYSVCGVASLLLGRRWLINLLVVVFRRSDRAPLQATREPTPVLRSKTVRLIVRLCAKKTKKSREGLAHPRGLPYLGSWELAYWSVMAVELWCDEWLSMEFVQMLVCTMRVVDIVNVWASSQHASQYHYSSAPHFLKV
jgi:hypothetical protein